MFTGEHSCRSVISVKLHYNFFYVTLLRACSPVDLLHIFRISFFKKHQGDCFWAGKNQSQLKSLNWSVTFHYIPFVQKVMFSLHYFIFLLHLYLLFFIPRLNLVLLEKYLVLCLFETELLYFPKSFSQVYFMFSAFPCLAANIPKI